MSYEKEYEVEKEINLNNDIDLKKSNDLKQLKNTDNNNSTMQYKLLAKEEQKKFLPLEDKEIKKRQLKNNLAAMVGIGALLAQCGVFVPEAYQPYFFLFFLIDFIIFGIYGVIKYLNLQK